MARKFKSMDGNEAAAYVSYAFTEVAGIYPITPSSPMADHVDQWAAQGMKNIFGTPVKVIEMESEAGGFPGPAAHDPEHVQDRWRAPAGRVPRLRAYGCLPRA